MINIAIKDESGNIREIDAEKFILITETEEGYGLADNASFEFFNTAISRLLYESAKKWDSAEQE